MDEWQKFFSNNTFHACLSNAAILLVEKAFREAKEVDVISSEVHQSVWDNLSDKVNKDLTVSLRCFYDKYDLNYDPLGWRSVNVLSICRVVQKKLEETDQREKLQKSRSLGWRVREAEPLFKLLREARNIAAHDLSNRSAIGWSTLIPATVLRVLELCPHPKNENAPIEEMTSECEAQLKQILGQHFSDQSNNSDELNGSAEQGTPTRQDTKSLETSLDRIEQLLLQQNAVDNPKAEDGEIVSGADVQSEDVQLPDVDWITPAMLKQELLALKQECANEFSQYVELGPKHNLFQKAMISDILSYRPGSAVEVLRLPDFGWRYKENISTLGQQFKFFEVRMDELLKRVDWD